MPAAVRYLPADLASEPMDLVLGRATEGASRRTVIACCGVTQYLTEAAISATLKAVATLPSATELIFTTFLPDERVPKHLRSGGRQIAELAAASGEPFLTRLSPEQTAALISDAGLKLVADMGAAELASLSSAIAQTALSLSKANISSLRPSAEIARYPTGGRSRPDAG